MKLMARNATRSKSWAVMRALGSRQHPASIAVPANTCSVSTPRRASTSSISDRYSAETEYSAGSIFRIVMIITLLRPSMAPNDRKTNHILTNRR